MCDAVVGFEEFELFACGKFIALPAAGDFLFSAAISDFAVRGAAVTSTSLFAAKFYHQAQQAIALVVILELLEEGDLCQHRGHLRKALFFQLLT